MNIRQLTLFAFFIALGFLCLKYAQVEGVDAQSNNNILYNIECTPSHTATTPSYVNFSSNIGTGMVPSMSMYTITNPVLNDTNSQHPITASLRTPTVYNTTIFSFFNGLKLQSLSVCLAMTNAYGILRANADSSNYPAVQFSPNESTLYTSYSNILGTAWKTIKTNGGMEGDNVTTNWGSNTTNKYGLAVNQLITAQSSGAAASRTVTFSLGINYP